MIKPDWKDAPARANYLAMDSSGYWHWYDLEPFAHESGVWATYSKCWDSGVKGFSDLSWDKTLEPRP